MHALVEGALAMSWLSGAALLCVVGLCYALLLAVYRLWLSPIAAFPGPSITAATGWYEFYHDVVRHGRFFEKIREMHEEYGVTPDTEHVRA